MLLSNLKLLAQAPNGVARLRELILTLAVQGKLVAQDPKDEPASALLQRVAANAPVRPAKGLKASGDSDEIAAPYGLPEGWAWSRLGDIVENMGSGWSPACDEGERSDPTRWAVLRTTAVQVNEYRAREHKAIPFKLSPRPEIEVKDGDILITRAGPMNRVGISCWVNNTPPRLMLSDKIVRFHSIADEMLPAFVVLALNAGWTKSLIEQAKTGMAASQVNISQTDLRGFWLPICSKSEQSRIVTRVEELMRLCDALEAKGQIEATQHAQLVSTLLATLTESETPAQLADNWHRIATHFDLLLDRPEAVDALEQTILQLAVRGLLVPQDPQDEPASQLVQRLSKASLVETSSTRGGIEVPFVIPNSWCWVSLENLARSMSNGLYKPAKFYSETGTACVRMYNIQDGHLDFSKLMRLDVTPSELVQYSLEPGDLLINRVNSRELVGKCAVVSAHHEPLVYEAMNIRVRLLELESMPSYVNLVLRTKRVREVFQGDAKQAVGQASINQTQVGGVAIPLPPLAEQSRIVTRVAQLRNLCADLRQRLTASQSTQAHLAEALVADPT